MRLAILVPMIAAWLAACSAEQAPRDAKGPADPPRDLSRVIALREAGECRFDALTEHAFEGLLLIGGEPGEVTSAPMIALGESRYEPRFERAPTVGGNGGHEYRSHARLPDGTTWQGLPLTELWVEFIAPPETDSLYRRGLAFAATPERVRAVLAANGHDVPVSPRFRELDELAFFAAATCGGAILIEPRAEGAALVCERGC